MVSCFSWWFSIEIAMDKPDYGFCSSVFMFFNGIKKSSAGCPFQRQALFTLASTHRVSHIVRCASCFTSYSSNRYIFSGGSPQHRHSHRASYDTNLLRIVSPLLLSCMQCAAWQQIFIHDSKYKSNEDSLHTATSWLKKGDPRDKLQITWRKQPWEVTAFQQLAKGLFDAC